MKTSTTSTDIPEATTLSRNSFREAASPAPASPIRKVRQSLRMLTYLLHFEVDYPSGWEPPRAAPRLACALIRAERLRLHCPPRPGFPPLRGMPDLRFRMHRRLPAAGCGSARSAPGALPPAGPRSRHSSPGPTLRPA